MNIEIVSPQIIQLQRKIDSVAEVAPQALRKLGLMGSSLLDIEEWRRAIGGVFGTRMGHEVRHDNGLWSWEQTSDWAFDPNIVTNEGLDHVLDIVLDDATDATGEAVATWYVIGSKTNTTPLATHTYAAPGFTEITGTDVSETVRETWTNGAVSSQSISNSASVATYTAAGSFTFYGAALGGADGTTGTPNAFSDTAATNSILYCSSLFASSKAMSASDTIDITYTATAADDGA